MYLNAHSIGKKQRGFISPGPSLFGKKSSGGGDPYWANVVSLLYFEGPNNSTTFSDETGKIWTPTNAVISTSQAKFGSSSGYFNGTAILTSPQSADWALTGDFTVEGWVYCAQKSNFGISFDNRGSGNTNQGYGIYVQTSNNIPIVSSNTGTVVSAPSIPSNTWTHYAVCRRSASVQMFVNGVGGTAAADGRTLATLTTACIGNLTGFNQQYTGYIDMHRVTKGVARYTTNFTPPTAPFPNHG